MNSSTKIALRRNEKTRKDMKPRRISVLSLLCLVAIKFLRCIRNLISRFSCHLILFVLFHFLLEGHSGSIGACVLHKLLDYIDSGLGSASFSRKNLPRLINDENTALCSLGSLLQTNGFDEGGRSVAEKRIRKLLLGLESCVGLGAVGREAVDA